VPGSYLGFWAIPFFGGEQPARMLIIGNPSIVTTSELDQHRDLVIYTIRPASALRATPIDTLSDYDQGTINSKIRRIRLYLQPIRRIDYRDEIEPGMADEALRAV